MKHLRFATTGFLFLSVLSLGATASPILLSSILIDPDGHVVELNDLLMNPDEL